MLKILWLLLSNSQKIYDRITTYSYNFKEGARNNIGAMVDKVCQNTCVMKCNKVSEQWPTPVYQQQIFIVEILIQIFLH